MCGRFTLRTSASVIAEQFALLEAPTFAARFNIAPTQPAPVIRMKGDGGTAAKGRRNRRLLLAAVPPSPFSPLAAIGLAALGLDSGWAKDPAIGSRLINARAESAAEKPAFRAAMRRRRCLVVADGFYEWQRSGPGTKGTVPFSPRENWDSPRAGRTKQPYFIRLRGDRPFAFAGIWEAWEGPDHSTLETCAILTTAANELVGPIHDRMPVILSTAGYAAWLDPAIEDPRQLAPLLAPYPSDEMEAHAGGRFRQ